MQHRGRAQRGFTLVEAAIAAALVATVLGGAFWALGNTVKYATDQTGPHRAAASDFARQMLSVAQNVWKYGDPGGSPSGAWQTTLPLALPDAPPTAMPVTVSATFSPLHGPDPTGVDPTEASATITIAVTYPPDAGHADPGSVSQEATVHVKAPFPGAKIQPAATVPAPAGAP